MVKIDAVTHSIIWEYTYGLNLTSTTGEDGIFFDIIEDPNTDQLYIAGRDKDNVNGVLKGVVCQLESNGDLNWIVPIAHSTWNTTFTEFNGLTMNSTGTVITAGGCCAKSGNSFRNNGTYGFLANFKPTSTGITALTTEILGDWDNPVIGAKEYVNFVFSLTYLNNDDLVAPCIEQCEGCEYYAGRPKEVIMYRFGSGGISLTSDLINTHTLELNAVHGLEAYDMQCGIDKTADGGFVFLSTKRTATPAEPTITMSDATTFDEKNAWPWPYSPPGVGNPPTYCPSWYWNTNAYVAKYDAGMSLEWVNTYPFLKYDNTVVNRGDVTKHECLYKIVQLPDGSFTGCGNNSANFDDHVLFNLHNDCQNRAATFTYDIGAAATTASYTYDVNVNTTWSTNKKIRGTVVVKSGYALTINNGAIIEFADTRKTDIPTTLIVEAGARLIINRATLTSLSDCDNSIWDGVQVYGDNTLAQSPVSNQGYMSIIDGTIENARIGLRVSASEYDDQTYWYHPVYDKTGGVISTNGATFLNNWKHVEFMKYNSPTGAPNSSVFAKTSFLYDGNFKDPNLAYAPSGSYRGYSDYVSLWDVQGVSFLGCTFENTSTDETRHRGRAIYSINATYKIDNYYDCPSLPCSTIIHCKFKNVREGIKALMFTSVNGPSLTVHDADFEGVRQGIGLSGFVLPYPKILSNRISLVSGGSLLHDHDEAWGIHATGCDKYDIEENSISSDFAPSDLMQRDVVGIAINNRHFYNTMVYKNNTKDLRTSILPFGENGSTGNDFGLLIKCNDQAQNELNDIDVRDDGGVSGVVKDEQGNCTVFYSDPFQTPAGNTFTDISGTATTVHLNADALSSPFNYHFRNGYLYETPLTFNVMISPLACIINYDNLCPSRKIEDQEELDFRAMISGASSSTEVELIEQQYFNYLFETNNVASVISYLLGKTGKNRHDSLTLSHAYTAVSDYTNALGILAGMSSADNVVSFLLGLNTELAADSINYNTNNSYTNALKPLVLDSTRLTSIYAENILRITNLFEYPFRIPYDSLTSSKKEIEIVRKTFESNLANVIVYPNPNNGKFTVLLTELAYQTGRIITVSDIAGRKLYSIEIEKNRFAYTMNLENAKGIYIVQVLNSNKKPIDSQKITIK